MIEKLGARTIYSGRSLQSQPYLAGRCVMDGHGIGEGKMQQQILARAGSWDLTKSFLSFTTFVR
jgi:hypothetical protein